MDLWYICGVYPKQFGVINMSEANQFRQEHILSGRLDQLTPAEFVALINGLCEAVEGLDTPFYGGINAANISLDGEGNVGLGEALPEGSIRYTADQIEYLAPEVFWNNERSVQADVYSIGMLMYTWSNAGCLPFVYPDATATDRAEALRRRMSGEAFDKSPISAALNKVVKKATAFKPQDRYKTITELQIAFKAFAAEAEAGSEEMMEKMAALKVRQAQEAAMMANILAAAEAAANTSSGEAAAPAKPKKAKQSKKAEPVQEEAPKKLSLRPLVAVFLVAAILMLAAVAMQFGNAGSSGDNSVDSSANPTATPVVPTADPSASPDVIPIVSTTPIVDGEDGDGETADPIVTPSPSPTTLVTIDTSKYTVYKANVSWNTAANNCAYNGGRLVCITTKEEFDGVTALAEKYGLEYVWVGGFRKSGSIVWLSNETAEYLPWASGEPSYRDTNGVQENFLLIMKNADGTWAYNDISDDPVTSYPDVYSGKIGYIMEK